MSKMTLTKMSFLEGVWSGLLENSQADQTPDILVSNGSRDLKEVQIVKDVQPNAWRVSVQVPVDVISDYGQVFLITDQKSGHRLNSFAVFTDADTDGSLRTEVDLLRAELDMLKSAFRRHCRETEENP